MSVIVSVLKDRLLCPFDDYRDLLNHMTGRRLPLWDVASARRACAERLTKTFPELADLPNPPEKTDSGNANKYVRQCVKATGGIDCYTIAPNKVKLAERTLSKAL